MENLVVEHALQHDAPLTLLRAAALALRDRQLLRPALSTLERLVASARARAARDTYERLEPLLDAQTRRALGALCVTDVRLGVSRLDEILTAPTRRSARRTVQALRELLRDLKTQTATAANEKVALFDLFVGLLLDDSVADDEVRARMGSDGTGALGGRPRPGPRDPSIA